MLYTIYYIRWSFCECVTIVTIDHKQLFHHLTDFVDIECFM